MQKYLAIVTLILLVGMVVARVLMLRKRGITAMQFGKLDKTDFIIPPFALFYFYLVTANAFGLPTPAHRLFFVSGVIGWIGVFFCFAGLALLLWSLISFGQSFRVGIDIKQPSKLVTSGAFSVSRNPIYVAFAFVLLGQCLIFPHWVMLLYLAAGVFLFHRQVLREEEFLREHYGDEFLDYCHKVRRYL